MRSASSVSPQEMRQKASQKHAHGIQQKDQGKLPRLELAVLPSPREKNTEVLHPPTDPLKQ